ncbi:Zn(2)-C6 fungal-type domain-containing protein [Mycena indigotica]|uniref:Zn(2)-C6 fungal-type domain-containing protein n=1 Tax=Mycena indigotica TaxID=2126181 RepID=A0A8H6T5U0_9AGAR|nr:Zn(2)-C6 fungal-type domain-containing protein [Mycena indigotica]KAF7312328.1 Zn(2)-C6 fungal-type domain-containing protein [Mycena indigotica]
MSNGYPGQTQQQWTQFPHQPPRLQLEHEFDFTPQQPQFSNSFQFSDDFSSRPFSYSRTHSPSGSVDHHHYNQNYPQFDQSSYLSTDQREYHGNSAPYNFQSASTPTPLTANGLGPITTSPQSIVAPTLPQPSGRGSGYYNPRASNTGQQPKTKRPRGPTTTVDVKEDEIEPELEEEGGARAKPPGACARCKNLKVKCEFKTDTDPCKRCFNGGHECVTPGRKKRRTPPKREHLLNQIREQAADIQKLMSQLEEANARHARAPNSAATDVFPPLTPSSGLHSPVLSPTSPTFGSDSTKVNSATNKVVEDWIAKARDSLAEFDGFIGIGGAGMPKSLLVKEDLEGSSSGAEDVIDSDDGNTGEYEIEVIDSDGEEVSPRSRRGVKLRQMSNTSNDPRSPKKKESGGEKLATLPTEASPFGLMADLSLKKGRAESPEAEMGSESVPALGIASDSFFRSSPAPDLMRSRPLEDHPALPHILTRGLITPQEAEKLFDMFIFPTHEPLCLITRSRLVHSIQDVLSESLFCSPSVVCAIASRFYTERPELYSQAMHYAQLAAGTALISGQKCVESVQGYILMSLYPVPARRWEDERGWLYLGLAIRLAIDLNLHLPNTAQPINESHAREMLNRTRVWLNCFNLDRSTGSQYGKTPTISNADYMANHSEDWWRSSPYNMRNFDIHTCAYNSELRNVDFERVASDTDEQLKELGDKWQSLVNEATDMTDSQNRFRSGLLKLAYSYARLVALSFGFQHAFGKNNTDENPFLMRCLAAASDVVAAMVEAVGQPDQRIYLRHGPIAQSVFVTFAASMLVKLLQPKFASYLTPDKRQEMRGLVKNVIDLLGSSDVSIDDKHGPNLYAKFLKGLLAAPLAKEGNKRKPTRSNSGQPSESSESTVSSHPSPDTTHSLSPPATTAALSFDRFAPPLGAGVDPFMPLSTNGLDDNTSAPDFFPPSLPFHDPMQGIQSLATNWPEGSPTWFFAVIGAHVLHRLFMGQPNAEPRL